MVRVHRLDPIQESTEGVGWNVIHLGKTTLQCPAGCAEQVSMTQVYRGCHVWYIPMIGTFHN